MPEMFKPGPGEWRSRLVPDVRRRLVSRRVSEPLTLPRWAWITLAALALPLACALVIPPGLWLLRWIVTGLLAAYVPYWDWWKLPGLFERT